VIQFETTIKSRSSYQEWRRDWPNEARQPVFHNTVLIPAEFYTLEDKKGLRSIPSSYEEGFFII
jgi:hypothetical protein